MTAMGTALAAINHPPRIATGWVPPQRQCGTVQTSRPTGGPDRMTRVAQSAPEVRGC